MIIKSDGQCYGLKPRLWQSSTPANNDCVLGAKSGPKAPKPMTQRARLVSRAAAPYHQEMQFINSCPKPHAWLRTLRIFFVSVKCRSWKIWFSRSGKYVCSTEDGCFSAIWFQRLQLSSRPSSPTSVESIMQSRILLDPAGIPPPLRLAVWHV